MASQYPDDGQKGLSDEPALRPAGLVLLPWRLIKRATQWAQNILLPQSCYLCAADAQRTAICSACSDSLPSMPSQRCTCCADVCPDATPLCGACLVKPPAFDATLACWAYGFPVDALVAGFKFHQKLALLPFLSAALSHLPRPDIDILVSIPLHPKRLRHRGFNQSDLLASRLARAWGVPYRGGALKRVRDNQAQHTLKLKHREKNAHHIFTALPLVKGLRVGVVDDVMTIGATLNDAARALKAEGALSVVNIVLARTLKT